MFGIYEFFFFLPIVVVFYLLGAIAFKLIIRNSPKVSTAKHLLAIVVTIILSSISSFFVATWFRDPSLLPGRASNLNVLLVPIVITLLAAATVRLIGKGSNTRRHILAVGFGVFTVIIAVMLTVTLSGKSEKTDDLEVDFSGVIPSLEAKLPPWEQNWSREGEVHPTWEGDTRLFDRDGNYLDKTRPKDPCMIDIDCSFFSSWISHLWSSYERCILQNMPGVENGYAVRAVVQNCRDRPRYSGRKKAAWLGHQNARDCVVKYSKSTANKAAAARISAACRSLYPL